MAHTIVETENAKYVLVFSDHFTGKEASPIHFDAFVVESGPVEGKHISRNSEYEKLVAQGLTEKAEFWITDAGASKKSRTRLSIGKGTLRLSALLGTVGLLNISRNSKKPLSRRKVLRHCNCHFGCKSISAT